MSISSQSSGELKYLLVHNLLLVFTDVSCCEDPLGIVKSSSPLCVLFLLETPAVVSSTLPLPRCWVGSSAVQVFNRSEIVVLLSVNSRRSSFSKTSFSVAMKFTHSYICNLMAAYSLVPRLQPVSTVLFSMAEFGWKPENEANDNFLGLCCYKIWPWSMCHYRGVITTQGKSIVFYYSEVHIIGLDL